MGAAQSVETTTEVVHDNVSCLFAELLVIIFCYLDVRSKGRASRVCRSWRNAAYERCVWRGVEAKLHIHSSSPQLFGSLIRRGITRVQVMCLLVCPYLLGDKTGTIKKSVMVWNRSATQKHHLAT